MDFSLRCAYAHGTTALRTHLDCVAPQEDDLLAGVRDDARALARPHRAAGAPACSASRACATGSWFASAGEARGGGEGRARRRSPTWCRTSTNCSTMSSRPPIEHGLDLDFHADETDDVVGRLAADASPRRRSATRLQGQGPGRPLLLAGAPAGPRGARHARQGGARPGIAVVSLPMCNLYLQDRAHDGTTPRWRGVTLLHEMKARGIPVAVASDNTRDPFYAYGDLDMLEVYRKATRILHFDHPVGDWPQAVAATPAAIMRLRRRGHARRRRRRPTSSSSAAAAGPNCCRGPSPTASWCATARAIDTRPARLCRTRRSDGVTDGHCRAEARPRRSEDRGQSGDRAAEEPRLLLVQPGAEAPARPRHRRPRRLAAERGRGDPRARRLPPARRAGDAARRRHRQLRAGHAAVGRRRARSSPT